VDLLFQAGMLPEGSRAVIITSQAGSAEWRFTQNPEVRTLKSMTVQKGDARLHCSTAALLRCVT